MAKAKTICLAAENFTVMSFGGKNLAGMGDLA
jgi:hypothetical protein